MSAKKMPPLGVGSVDLAVLHAAEAKGEDLAAAIRRAKGEDVDPPKPAKSAKAEPATGGE